MNSNQGSSSTLDSYTQKRSRTATNFEKLYILSLFEKDEVYSKFEIFDVRLNSNVWDSSERRSYTKQHFSDSCVKFHRDYEINLKFEIYYPLHITCSKWKIQLFVAERDHFCVQKFKVLGQRCFVFKSVWSRVIIRGDTTI